MRTLLFSTALVAAVAFSNPLAASGQERVVPHLHIWTQAPASGIVDEQSKSRATAVEEISKRIKPKVAALVNEDTSETVSFQIMEVASKATGSLTNWGFGIISANKRSALRAEIVFRDYRGDFVCDTRATYMRDLAIDCTKKIEQWLKDNRAVSCDERRRVLALLRQGRADRLYRGPRSAFSHKGRLGLQPSPGG